MLGASRIGHLARTYNRLCRISAPNATDRRDGVHMARRRDFEDAPLSYPSSSPFRPPDGRLRDGAAYAASLAERAWLRAGLRVRVRFLGQGHQWPLRPGDAVALTDPAHNPLGELPAELVLHLIAHHVHAAELVAAVQRALAGAGVQAITSRGKGKADPLGGRFFEDRDTRAELRAARRRRKRR